MDRAPDDDVREAVRAFCSKAATSRKREPK
jgi:hypothetical protein